MTVPSALPTLTLAQLHELRARVAATISLHPDLKGQSMPNKATKSDLVEHLVLGNSISKAYAAKLVDQLFDFIIDRLDAGESVALRGFGTFELRERAGRMGRNPRTGEPVEIAPSIAIGFRAAKRVAK